jgi:hypothetical protein
MRCFDTPKQKLQHGMDFKRFDRPDNPDKAARRRRTTTER